MTRIAMLGGAFDPPHVAHVELARVAMKELALDELRVVPTGMAWHKTRTLSDGHHRLAMARLAFAELPGAVVDSCEIDRQGPSYSLDTLREIVRSSSPSELFLIIGSDQARALPSWRGWPQHLDLAIICVATREDTAGLGSPFVPSESQQTRFRSLTFAAMDVSATDIRSRVARGLDISSLVCRPVASYIHEHHLYQAA